MLARPGRRRHRGAARRSVATSPIPTSNESAYEGTPVAPLRSMLRRRHRADQPTRTASMHDAAAVVDLAAGPRRRAGDSRVPRRPLRRPGRAITWLERSYHVATQDYDNDADLRRRPSSSPPSRRPLMFDVAREHSRARRSGAITIGPLSTPRLRADDRARRDRRRVAAGSAARGRAGVGTRDDASSIGDVGRDRRRHRRPALPRRHRLGAVRGRPRPRSRRSGRAVSASLAACSSGSLVGAVARSSVAASTSAVGHVVRRPALALAQAIGRWGNWFNQELFGKPTDLPWALRDRRRQDAGRVRAGHDVPSRRSCTSRCGTSRCAACCCWIDRKHMRSRPGRLFAMYVVGYGIGRFWIEGLRIDPAHELGGLRWNQWVAARRRRDAVPVDWRGTWTWLRRPTGVDALRTGARRPRDEDEPEPCSRSSGITGLKNSPQATSAAAMNLGRRRRCATVTRSRC